MVTRKFFPTSGGGGTPQVDLVAERIGLRVMALDPALASDVLTMNPGVAIYQLLYVPRDLTLTTTWVWMRQAGATPTGANHMGLFAEDGTQLGLTGDMTAAFSTDWDFVSGTLAAPVDVAAGSRFYIGAVTHFDTAPVLFGLLQGFQIPAGGFNGHYTTVYETGRGVLPSSFDPTGVNRNTGAYAIGVS